jgi:16S rRNA (guanine1207-N2)-methyltransferase
MPENTSLKLNAPDGQWLLSRPAGGDMSLKAWDAADELLLEHSFRQWSAQDCSGQTDLQKRRVLIVDDQFGALTLGLSSLCPDVVADSAVLPHALARNAILNTSGMQAPFRPQVYNWMQPPTGRYDLIIMRIPRHSDYLAWLLRWANGILADNGVLLAGGMIKHLPDKSVKVFGEAVVTDEVTPARKKARVIICRRGSAGLKGWPGTWKGYALDDRLTIEALPAVFAREKLDIGAQLLLPHVTASTGKAGAGARVLDLACGNGILGIQALQARADLAITFSDVSSQAIVSTHHNVTRLFPDAQATFEHADGIAATAGRFQQILLNPPFHEGGAVGDHIALKLFSQAAKHLSATGRVLMVGNRHLGYHRSLRRFFPVVRQLDADARFVVFEAGVNGPG